METLEPEALSDGHNKDSPENPECVDDHARKPTKLAILSPPKKQEHLQSPATSSALKIQHALAWKLENFENNCKQRSSLVICKSQT